MLTRIDFQGEPSKHSQAPIELNPGIDGGTWSDGSPEVYPALGLLTCDLCHFSRTSHSHHKQSPDNVLHNTLWNQATMPQCCFRAGRLRHPRHLVRSTDQCPDCLLTCTPLFGMYRSTKYSSSFHNASFSSTNSHSWYEMGSSIFIRHVITKP